MWGERGIFSRAFMSLEQEVPKHRNIYPLPLPKLPGPFFKYCFDLGYCAITQCTHMALKNVTSGVETGVQAQGRYVERPHKEAPLPVCMTGEKKLGIKGEDNVGLDKPISSICCPNHPLPPLLRPHDVISHLSRQASKALLNPAQTL